MFARPLRRLSALVVPLIALGITTADAQPAARPYPSGLIRVVVPSAAGTPPDIVCRIVVNEIAQSEGWRVIVENRPGAIQSIGLTDVLKQPADGYTIACIAMSATAAPALLPNVGFKLDSDFAAVIKLATAHHILVVHPSVPATSLPELVALLKNEPQKFTFSSGGFGTPAHLAGEMFKLEAGVQATHVPYQGLAKAIPDLLNGTNHFQFITPLPVLDLIESGKLRALAVTAAARLPILKDVPTVGEAGFPALIVEDWFGVVVKRGTTNEMISRMNAAMNSALAQPRAREAIARMAAEPAGGTPAQFGALIRDQLAHWSKVVKESGIKVRQ
jgi:tripartite-type tricarboxylate transporter receptor subunit TctC